ncbi:MAG: zf-HC2 domain-containing protein [Pseudobdellovibrionaceae bacterium]
MLRCHEIVKILSSDEELSFLKRAELKMHLTMCVHCSKYARHLKILKESFTKFFKLTTHVEKDQVTKLENQVIEKIKKSGSG